MSASMYWRPSPPKPDGEGVDYQVHRAIAPRIWGHDGTLISDPHTIDSDVIPYLEGLRDAGMEGAQELIDAIRKHGEIEIWIER